MTSQSTCLQMLAYLLVLTIPPEQALFSACPGFPEKARKGIKMQFCTFINRQPRNQCTRTHGAHLLWSLDEAYRPDDGHISNLGCLVQVFSLSLGLSIARKSRSFPCKSRRKELSNQNLYSVSKQLTMKIRPVFFEEEKVDVKLLLDAG